MAPVGPGHLALLHQVVECCRDGPIGIATATGFESLFDLLGGEHRSAIMQDGQDGLGALESGEVTSEGDAGLDGSELGLHGSESGDLLGNLAPLGRDVSLELGDAFGPGHLGLQRQRTKSSLSLDYPPTLSGEALGCTRPRLCPGLHAEPHAETHAEVPPTWDFRALGVTWTSKARWRA